MAPCSAGWMEEDGKSYALPPPPPPTPCFPVGRRREEEEKFQTSAVVTPLSGIFLLTVRFQKDSPFAPHTAEISRTVKKERFLNLFPSCDERQSRPRVLLTWKGAREKCLSIYCPGRGRNIRGGKMYNRAPPSESLSTFCDPTSPPTSSHNGGRVEPGDKKRVNAVESSNSPRRSVCGRLRCLPTFPVA